MRPIKLWGFDALSYSLSSIRTLSYWRYALFSPAGITRTLAFLGGIYLVLEALEFFRLLPGDRFGILGFITIVIVSLAGAVATRRPVSRISYKVPKKDFAFDVVVGDLLESTAPNIVISTNTTFDTDIGSGLISPDSVQGKFTARFFNGNTEELDRQLNGALEGLTYDDHPTGKGKKRRYPIGTVAKVQAHGKTFYWTAMAELNENGTAHSNVGMLDTALEKLWSFMADQGELGDVATAVIGTGRGRLRLPRNKVIERIAQSFADGSQDKVFANRLTIFVHPRDAERFGVNLFEIRDYLVLSLHA